VLCTGASEHAQDAWGGELAGLNRQLPHLNDDMGHFILQFGPGGHMAFAGGWRIGPPEESGNRDQRSAGNKSVVNG
jgi:hypothetical protein